MIKNVIFDMGQVLINWRPDMFTSGFGLSEADEKLLSYEMFEHEQEWGKTDEGTMTLDDAVRSMCSRLPEHLHPCVEKITKGWWHICLSPMEGMAELLHELKNAGYRLYVLSNASLAFREYFNLIPGSECFDGLYVSAEHKLIKPNKEIYIDFLNTFDLTADECIFIDDRPDNIAAAGQQGIHGIVYSGNVSELRGQLKQANII